MLVSRCCALFRAVGVRLAWLTPVLFATAGASAPVSPESATQEDWVMSYALVIICVGLAAFVVCRPGHRSQDIRRPV